LRRLFLEENRSPSYTKFTDKHVEMDGYDLTPEQLDSTGGADPFIWRLTHRPGLRRSTG